MLDSKECRVLYMGEKAMAGAYSQSGGGMDLKKAQPWDEPWGRGCEVSAAARLSE